MRREPKHQVQDEEDENNVLPREFKIERWLQNGMDDTDLLRELSMLSILSNISFSIISLVVSGLDTKKKLFSSFVDKPADTKHARVDKFEAIKGRLLKEKYSPGRGAI